MFVNAPHPKRRSVFADKLDAFADFVRCDEAAVGLRSQWHAFFRDRIGDSFDGRIVLEIGCSDAATLNSMAMRHPTTGFVGIDWKYRQIYLGAERIAAMALHNVALLRDRAQNLRAIFADGELDEILIFQPEPCDRPEELPNRLVTSTFLNDLQRLLNGPAATITLKTDHAESFDELVAAIEDTAKDSSLRIARISRDFWNDAATLAQTADRCFAGEKTLFEQRFIRRRQPIYYVELRGIS